MRKATFTFDRCGTDETGGPVYPELNQAMPAGRRCQLDRTAISCSSLSRTYEVPGRHPEPGVVGAGALARPDFAIAVYGRGN